MKGEVAMAVATKVERELDDAVSLIDRLVAFGSGGPDHVVSDVPNLTQAGARLLEAPGGRAIVATWSSVFNDTIALVHRFRDTDMHQDPRPTDRELEEAVSAAAGTVEALVKRLNRLAQRRNI
jgi:hypothetical protein